MNDKSPFLDEYLESRADASLGTVIIRDTTLTRSGIPLLLFVVVAIGSSLWLAGFSKSVALPGVIKRSVEATELGSPTAGAIYFVDGRSDGATVDAGDELFRVLPRTNFLSSISADSSSFIAKNIQEQISTISEAEQHRKQQMRSFLLQIDTKIRSLNDEKPLLEEAIRLKEVNERDILAVIAKMEMESYSGATSRLTFAEWKSRLMDTRVDILSSQRLLSKLLVELKSLQLERDKLTSEAEKLASFAELDVLKLEAKVLEQEREDTVRVFSPIAGTLVVTKSAEGTHVDAGEIVAKVVPAESTIIGELYVDADLLNSVKEGTSLELQYDAFPHQVFGTFSATVTKVSGDRAPLAGNTYGSVSSNTEQTYRVTASLEDFATTNDGQDFEIFPGMTFVAIARGDRRSLYEWLRTK